MPKSSSLALQGAAVRCIILNVTFDDPFFSSSGAEAVMATGAQGSGAGGDSTTATMEDKLSAALVETADEIAHAECFDAEQRAEVYSILDALKLDTEAHRAQMKLLTERLKARVGDG